MARKNTTTEHAKFTAGLIADLKTIENRGYGRDQVINLLQDYVARLGHDRQNLKEAEHYFYSRREGTQVREKAEVVYTSISYYVNQAVDALGMILEQYDICSACFGKGHEDGWTCPNCNGNTYRSAKAYYCAGPCRQTFSPTTEHQTYCVNCAKYAPSAKAAGLEEDEWRAISVLEEMENERWLKASRERQAQFSTTEPAPSITPEEATTDLEAWVEKEQAEQEEVLREIYTTEDDWAAEGSPLIQHITEQVQKKKGKPMVAYTDVKAEKTRNGDGIEIIRIWSGNTVYTGYADRINIGAKEQKDGWRFGVLGLVPTDQGIDVYDHSNGQFLEEFTTPQGAFEFIYQSLTSGLVSTVYAPRDTAHTTKPEKPAEVTTEAPTSNEPHPHSITGMLQRIDRLEARVETLFKLVARLDGENMGLMAWLKAGSPTTEPAPGYEDRVNKAIIAQLTGSAPSTTTEEDRVVAEVNDLIETACPNPECVNGLITLGVKCSVCKGTGEVVAEPSTEHEDNKPDTAEHIMKALEDPVLVPMYVEWAIYVLGHRQEADELALGITEYTNGVGFNSSDARFGTELFKWLNRQRDTQPHLTEKQLAAARRMLKKYVNTQLVPALRAEAWGGPHIASTFKAGDWVEVQNEGAARCIAGHDWLNLYFYGGGVARWFDCIQCEAPHIDVPSGAELEEISL